MIFKLVALGVISTVLILLLKDTRPEMALLTGVASGILMLLVVFDRLFDVIDAFYRIAEKTQIDMGLFSSVLKIIGVGYLTEFSANVCADAGSKSVGDKIMLGGKVVIIVLALPIINSLVEIITGILP